jgi:glucose/arabinose dehydrogenase
MAGKPAPLRWVTHYPRVLLAHRRRGEAGVQAIEAELRAAAAEQPEGKFGKLQAAYVPSVPIPPFGWRHKCGHCRFWVDHGPGKPGECMIVGREDDPLGGKAIHEKAGCALYMPPAGQDSFDWIAEQLDPAGADVVRGEFHPSDEAPDEARSGRGGSERRAGGPYVPAGERVGLEPVVEGLAAPVAIVFHPEADVRYVADQQGVVHLHDGDGLGDGPLLDLRERIVDLRSQYDERGLLGLALHPEFPEDPRLFARYSAPVREGTPDDYDHTEVLASFELDDGGRTADADDESALLEIPSPQFNHNGGDIAFGPDGYLHVALGDGGSEGDRGPGHVDGGNGQDISENLLGSILRIDVDARGTVRGEERRYDVPEANPLVGEEGLDELYAWGLRNPWGMSFDGDGRLFVADVGQHLFEEVNVVESGGNYGWNLREGSHCFDPARPADPPEDCPEESRRGEPLRDPIVEYPHVHEGAVVGSAVSGGYVYEGGAIDALAGSYVLGDWATTQDRPSGRLFAAEPGEGGDEEPWSMTELSVTTTGSGRIERNVLGFGRDPDGELYVLANETHVPKGDTGAVLRLVPPGR